MQRRVEPDEHLPAESVVPFFGSCFSQLKLSSTGARCRRLTRSTTKLYMWTPCWLHIFAREAGRLLLAALTKSGLDGTLRELKDARRTLPLDVSTTIYMHGTRMREPGSESSLCHHIKCRDGKCIFFGRPDLRSTLSG
jgi:hypothetical protein